MVLSQDDKPDPKRTKLSRGSALAAGGAILLASNLVRQILAFLALIVTARLLTPEDFGVIAYFLVATTLLDMLQRQISMVLIRIEDVSYDHLHTVFTLQIMLGLLGATLFWFAGPLIELTGLPELKAVLPAISAYALLVSIRNPRFILYERGLRFSMAVVEETLNRVIYVALAIYLSWLWRDYWALITAIFASFAASILFSYIAAPMLPRLSLARWKDSLSFSSWAIGSQLCQFLSSRMPLLVIGAALGLAEAGIFRIGMRVTDLVTKQFFAVLQRVVYPGLADVSRSTGKKKEAFMRLNALLLGMSLPLSVGTALIAEDVVVYGFGEKWADAALVIWVLAPLAGLVVLQKNVRAASYVDGAMRMLFMRNALLLACVSLFMWIGTQYGFTGGIIAAGLSSFTALVLTLYMARQFGNGGFLEPLTVAWRSFAACGIMVIAVLGMDMVLQSDGIKISVVSSILAKIGIGLTVYTLIHGLLWRFAGRPEGFETVILSMFKRALSFLKNRKNA